MSRGLWSQSQIGLNSTSWVALWSGLYVPVRYVKICRLTGGGPPLQRPAHSNRLAMLVCVLYVVGECQCRLCHRSVSKVNVDLYSAYSWSTTSNALPFPVSRRWSPKPTQLRPTHLLSYILFRWTLLKINFRSSLNIDLHLASMFHSSLGHFPFWESLRILTDIKE